MPHKDVEQIPLLDLMFFWFHMTNICIGCGSPSVQKILDLGVQPPSNRYPLRKKEESQGHSLQLGFCGRCGLSQLIDPMAFADVRSHYDWITYNEPEGHLDDLVDGLCANFQNISQVKVTGITYKDDTTLARLLKKGVSSTYRLDQKKDLGIDEPLASLETIQNELTVSKAEQITSEIGLSDIVLVRHILEHAHDPRELLKSSLAMCKKGGLVVFEVPDCRKVLDGNDHCFLWEEHISYFTPATLTNFLGLSGLVDTQIKVYPYPMEDSLIAIVRNTVSNVAESGVPLLAEQARIDAFAQSFAVKKKRVRSYLEGLKKEGSRIALFGAGHLAAKYVNFYNLAPMLVGVIDDNPNKLGRFMTGSGLPIIGSASLNSGEVDLCLLTLNPESEKKVRNARKQYLENGGRFYSIFSASDSSLEKEMPDD